MIRLIPLLFSTYFLVYNFLVPPCYVLPILLYNVQSNKNGFMQDEAAAAAAAAAAKE